MVLKSGPTRMALTITNTSGFPVFHTLPSLFPNVSPLVCSILFYNRCQPPLLHHDSPTDHDTSVLIDHRLASVALQYFEEHGVRPSASNIRRLREAAFRDASVTARVVAHLPMAQSALQAANVSSIIIKGPSIAYANRKAARPYRDIDLLVRPEAFDTALHALQTAGYHSRPTDITPTPWFSRRCREAVNLQHPAGGRIDLHHHIPPWLWTARLTYDYLDSHAHLQTVGDCRMRASSLEVNLIISAFHIVTDHGAPGLSLMPWRDFVTLSHVVDPSAFSQLTRSLQLDTWFSWIAGQLPRSVISSNPLLQTYTLNRPPRSTIRLNCIATAASSPHSVLHEAARLPLLNAVLCIAAYLYPSSAFIHARCGRGRLARLRWYQGGLVRVRAALQSLKCNKHFFPTNI